jgi:hypothetical protein
MKHTAQLIRAGLAVVSVAATTGHLSAQGFSSGSTGALGALVVTSNTVVQLPPDGVLNYTTININQNTTLTFQRNALNTPVYLLAQSDVLIQGSIVVSGQNNAGAIPGLGGPGGFDGGFGGSTATLPSQTPGDGHGPGGGLSRIIANQWAYNAAFAVPNGVNSNIYGNALLLPLVGGSGGGGWSGNPGQAGGGGGGALLIASSTRITQNGSLWARGGNGGGNGSAGAVRLVAPIVTGSGQIYADSPAFGRVRIDCPDNTSWRNITIYGSASRGNRMIVFPPNPAQLRIVSAAGQAIPADAGAAVNIELPANSNEQQNVTLRGIGFVGNVPVRVNIVPETGESRSYDLTLNGAANPAEVSVTVDLRAGVPTRIEAWTR